MEGATTTRPRATKELERSLGLWSVAAISTSSMLGSGIFVLPGLAVADAGRSAWLSYLLAGVCVLPAALCKAELATAMPTSGGTYVFLDRILGPFAGTVVGAALWLSMLFKSSFALLGFGAYLLAIVHLPARPTAATLLGLIVVLNVLGVRKVGKVQAAVVAVALSVLAVLITMGLGFAPHVGESTPWLEHGALGLVAATSLVFVSYNGVTKVAAIAEEVKDPRRNLPWGILLSLTGMTVVYSLVALTLVKVLPEAELAGDLRPIYTLAQHLGGSWAGAGAAVLGVVTLTAMANSGLLAASRFPFAMSRDGLLPAFLRSVHKGYGTPVASILLTGIAMGLSVAFFDVALLAKLASGLVIVVFMSVNVAVILYRESRVSWYNPGFRAPLYPWLQAFGVLSGLGLLIVLGPVVIAGALMATVPGIALYAFYGKRRVTRQGVIAQRARRTDLLHAPPSPRPGEQVVAGEQVVTDADVVVALYGTERSPEMLVEVGTALADGGRTQVIHLTEVPEQLALDAVEEDDARLRSLRRRIAAMAGERELDVGFRAIASRDLARSVYGVAGDVRCQWLVMESRGRARRTVLAMNPLGWTMNQLDANLAVFRDAGVRYVREILVYAEPGPHDALVVATANHLALLNKAHVTLVRFVPDGAPRTTLQAETDYLGQLAELCSAPVRQEILGGKRLSDAMVRASAAYDLLVMGAPDLTLRRLLGGSAHNRIEQQAACSVLVLRTPRVRTHEALASARSDGHAEQCIVPAYLEPAAVGARLPIARKDALFLHMAEVVASALDDVTVRTVVEALDEREGTQNTSVGMRVALPHATVPAAPRALVGVFTTEAPIDYGGPDGEPVDVFFLTICPPSERHTHLRLLAGISRLVLETDLLVRLRAATTAAEIRHAVHECAAAVDAAHAAGRTKRVSRRSVPNPT